LYSTDHITGGFWLIHKVLKNFVHFSTLKILLFLLLSPGIYAQNYNENDPVKIFEEKKYLISPDTPYYELLYELKPVLKSDQGAWLLTKFLSENIYDENITPVALRLILKVYEESPGSLKDVLYESISSTDLKRFEAMCMILYEILNNFEIEDDECNEGIFFSLPKNLCDIYEQILSTVSDDRVKRITLEKYFSVEEIEERLNNLKEKLLEKKMKEERDKEIHKKIPILIFTLISTAIWLFQYLYRRRMERNTTNN
jgi:hypothetical protein